MNEEKPFPLFVISSNVTHRRVYLLFIALGLAYLKKHCVRTEKKEEEEESALTGCVNEEACTSNGSRGFVSKAPEPRQKQ